VVLVDHGTKQKIIGLTSMRRNNHEHGVFERGEVKIRQGYVYTGKCPIKKTEQTWHDMVNGFLFIFFHRLLKIFSEKIKCQGFKKFF
jgi:hypothetical protein